TARGQFTQLYAAAVEGARAAAWARVERDARSALNLEEAYTAAFKDFPLLDPTRQLLARARGELASAQERKEQQSRLPRAKEHLSDAVFFGTFATGLGLEDDLARTRRAVAEGLALFGVRADNGGPPTADTRFFGPAELRLITDLCYQLL